MDRIIVSQRPEVSLFDRALRRFAVATLLISAHWLCQVAVVSADPPRIKAGRLRVEIDRFINFPPSSELLYPVFMAAPNDGSDRLFFLEKGVAHYPIPEEPPLGYSARIRMYKNGTFSTFLDISSEISPHSDGGLLGLAFHPGFADANSPGYRKLYTFHSGFIDPGATVDFFDNSGVPTDHHNIVTEWQVDANNPNVVDVSTRREIFRSTFAGIDHNSGNIAFGPDGYLYGTIGTPLFGGTTALLTGQDNSDLLGTMYRIDPLAPSLTSGSANPISANGKYRIPADNPFVGDPLALDEIFAYGLRNTYRFSIDPVSGLVFGGDVGQVAREEVNVIPKGGNMGWPYREGELNGPVASPPPPLPTFLEPIAQYTHHDGSAIVGGHVYRGSIAALQNKYIFGDFSNAFFQGHGRLLAADVFDESGQLRDPADVKIQEILLAPQSCNGTAAANVGCALDVPLVAIGVDADGELYAVGLIPSQAVVYKITDAYLLPEGDYNEDGVVDAADYTVWRNMLTQTVPLGTLADGNGNGTIDEGDYQVWKANYGESITLGSGSNSNLTVPGPNSFLLAFQVLIGFVVSVRDGRWKLCFSWMQSRLPPA